MVTTGDNMFIGLITLLKSEEGIAYWKKKITLDVLCGQVDPTIHYSHCTTLTLMSTWQNLTQYYYHVFYVRQMISSSKLKQRDEVHMWYGPGAKNAIATLRLTLGYFRCNIIWLQTAQGLSPIDFTVDATFTPPYTRECQNRAHKWKLGKFNYYLPLFIGAC